MMPATPVLSSSAANSAATSATTLPLIMPPIQRGKPAPVLIRYPLSAVMYGIVKPLVKRTSKSPRMQRMMQRMAEAQTQRLARGFEGYTPDKHDVFVCTYFKSGTNWTLQIALQIAFRGKAEYAHIHDVVPWPDAIVKKLALDVQDRRVQLISPTELRVIKTHLDWKHMPYSEHARYITVIRDPKDVFVSAYRFFSGLGMDVMIPDVSTWFDLFQAEVNTIGGTWSKYIAEYWALRDLPNVLILSYKAMQQDLPGTVRKVAQFMGVDLTPEEFESVCAQSTFAYMKTIDHKFNPGVIVPWKATGTEMIRKGKSGGSSELLTLEQQRQLDTRFQEDLRQLGSDFPYAEFCEVV